jgi:hypothetical protein
MPKKITSVSDASEDPRAGVPNAGPGGSSPSVQRIPIDDIHVDAANVRVHGERNLGTIGASVAQFGYARSIVLDAQGVVRAGNGTIGVAKASGLTSIVVVDVDGDDLVAVRRRDWSPTQATGYAIADNRSAELASWDYQALAVQLEALKSDGMDLAVTGWLADEVANFAAADWSPPAESDMPDRGPGGGEPDAIELTAEQRRAFVLAIDHLRRREADPGMTDGRCLQVICEEFTARTR